MQLVNSEQAKALDIASERLGVSTAVLMENAGRAVVAFLEKEVRSAEGPVVFFIGKGNNGGDGLVAANRLAQKKYSVFLVKNEEDLKRNQSQLKTASYLVDALLGTGLKGEVKGWMISAIQCINDFRENGKKVLAIDIPSGLSAQTGMPLGLAVKASTTLCLGFVKLGLVLYPGIEYAGRIQCVDIGIPKEALSKITLPLHLLEPGHFSFHFKKRPKDSHKKDFGHVLVVGGSKEMPGAGFLSSLAALRSGAGLVTYATMPEAYQKFEPDFAEVMVASVEKPADVLALCDKKNAVVLGPGLGRQEKRLAFAKELIEKIPLPLIVDADGLMAMTRRKGPTILTPHPGEMATLLKITIEEVQANRVEVASEAAKIFNSIVVLKGYRSLIAFPDGKLYVNPTGNPGMATAGMGDILAGIIGGFLAQGFSTKAAVLAGVYLHGLAGDMAAEEIGEKGLITSDVLRYMPKAIRLIEQAERHEGDKKSFQ